jgi:hypothetical protein
LSQYRQINRPARTAASGKYSRINYNV